MVAIQAVAEEDRLANQNHQQTSDFLWTYTEEPHRSRRQAIIKAHPEVLKLCGPESSTKWLVLAVVSLQVLCACILYDCHPLDWKFLATAYAIGATANQNLFLAIHEISHNLACQSPPANRMLAIFANLPIAIPYSASFRPYHLTHHKSLGVDGVDPDLPSRMEAYCLDSVLGKAFFATFQILFYALRPMFVYALPVTNIQMLNVVVQVTFDLLLVRFWGWSSLIYLLLSSFLAGSLHPCAGHFIAEHYCFAKAGLPNQPAPHDPKIPLPETYSYYGPLNALTYNVGLHNEHHDFPAIPWSRLPRLNEIAREFYYDLPHHTSWVYVLYQFILDERVGLWCRVRRQTGGRVVGRGWREQDLGANESGGMGKEGVR